VSAYYRWSTSTSGAGLYNMFETKPPGATGIRFWTLKENRMQGALPGFLWLQVQAGK